MNFIILGGTNDEKGELNQFTKNRIITCYEMLSIYKEKNESIIIHFSGGFNKKFNKTNISHADICKNYFAKLNQNKFQYDIRLHEKNDNTVEEAIHFGKFFANNTTSIKIITNDWHCERVKYLFNTVFNFYNIRDYELICVNTDNIDTRSELYTSLLLEESNKLKQLKEKSYGIWKEWLVSNYYNKTVSLRLIERNDLDGNTIVRMRNENNEYFFDTSTFYWDSFKEIFYNKYFSNEIPPFFVMFEDKVIGFIGCKTIKTDVNDICIMFLKKYQNCGFGKISLSKFLQIYNDEYNNNENRNNKTIIAKILKYNIGSYKIFLANDFIVDETNTTNEIYYLTYR